jgi:hypothetical protein
MFNVGVIKIILNYSLKEKKIVNFVMTNLWQAFCSLHFSLNLHYFSKNFPKRITKVQKSPPICF